MKFWRISLRIEVDYAKRNNTRIYCNGDIICPVVVYDDCRSFTMITEEEKRMLVNLAKQIKEGIYTPERVFEAFERYPDRASEIVNFWLTHNEFTQNVVNYLAIEKLRLKFERCFEKELPKWHWKIISYGLTCMKKKLKKIWN